MQLHDERPARIRGLSRRDWRRDGRGVDEIHRDASAHKDQEPRKEDEGNFLQHGRSASYHRGPRVHHENDSDNLGRRRVDFPALGAQLQPADVANPTFDVISVKPNKSGDGNTRWGRHPGGGWFMVNMASGFLIRQAYPTKIDEFIGAPAWVMSDRFDVDARAAFVPTVEQERLMLRALLADCFKLAAHYETHERPIYHLVIARPDGRVGPQLRRIDIDCATFKQPTAASGQPAPPADEPRPCTHRMRGGTTLSIVSGGRTMQYFADPISGYAERPVLDKTDLTGYYAFRLEFGGGNDDLSIFTALQEQLGLKLEPARGPLDVLVIDHIERPTEN